MAIQKIKIFFQNNYWSLIVIILFFIFIFGLHYNSFNVPWEGDEGEYAYSAWLLRQNEVPYAHSFLQKPPLIIYTYYLAHLIKPWALWPPRLLAFFFTLANCFLLALIARRLYGKKAAWAALWISALLLSLPRIGLPHANTEKFMLLPLVGLIALAVFKRGREKRRTYFLAGVLGALAILYKPIALPPVLLTLIYWLVSGWLKTKNFKEALKASGLIILGSFLTALLALFYFIIRGAFGDLWQQVFIYNLSYAADTKQYFPEQFIRYSKIFLVNYWPIALLAAASLIWRPKLGYLWQALFLISLVPVITTRIGHYYLLLVPFIVLLASGALSKLLNKIKEEEADWRNIILIIFIALAAAVFFSLNGEQFFLSASEMPKWLYGADNNFNEDLLMAAKVKQYTSSGNRIFVAGSEPQIYYFSQRPAVSKFNVAFPLSINTPWRAPYQQEIIQELQETKPPAIVLPLGASGLLGPETPTRVVDFLIADLKANYNLVGGTVSQYQAAAYLGPAWVGPKDLATSSLLLFIRK